MDKAYNQFLASVKYKDPEADQLLDDLEMSVLHDLLPLLRLGYLSVHWGKDEKGRFLMLEIKDKSS